MLLQIEHRRTPDLRIIDSRGKDVQDREPVTSLLLPSGVGSVQKTYRSFDETSVFHLEAKVSDRRNQMHDWEAMMSLVL